MFISAMCKTALLLSVVVVSGCQEQIIHDLSESEANRVISRFSGTDIVPSKVSQSDGRWAIAVPRQAAVSALSYLDSHRVLSTRGALGLRNSKGGLVPSREEQWFSYQRAVSHSIEDTLNTLTGVLEAHVHVNLPQYDPLLGRQRDGGGTGSVLLLIDDRFGAQDGEISALVAGAAGVPAAGVTVLRSVAPRSSSPIQSSNEMPVVPSPASIVNAEDLEIAEVPMWVPMWAPLAVVGVAGVTLLCLVARWIAFRLRARRRVRFSLPAGGDHEG